MADYTWTNSNACCNWNVAVNWAPNVAGGPVDGDTVRFLDGRIDLPNANFLAAGAVVVYVDGESADGGTAWTQDITDFIGATGCG